MLSFLKSNTQEDWKCSDGKAIRNVDGDVECLTTNGRDCMPNACINDKLSPLPNGYTSLKCLLDPKKWCNPLTKPVENPIVQVSKNTSSTVDYIYYLIDILASIVAITLALIYTKDNYNKRVLHLIAAIMFRYVYLAYFLFNTGLAAFKVSI
jgi:hypothetical protein